LRTAGTAAVLASLLACSSHTTETPPEESAETETEAVKPAPVIDEDADNQMHAMCDALAAATQFSFRAESTFDETMSTDQPVELSAASRVVVRRPDGLFVDRRSDRGHRQFRFDGKSRVCALLDVDKNLYAQGTAPPTVEETLDALHDVFGVTIPLADIAVDDPYEAFNTDVETAVYVGDHDVRGTKCHHVAYSNDTIDWQIWIQAEGEPVPRKVAIVYKTQPGTPRYTAYLSEWNLHDKTPATEFEFRAPEGSRRISMLERAPVAEEGGDR
jgi:hypothetical protein